MNILTIFAGRQANLNILIKYLKKALDMKILDEVHLWNNTRNINDEEYIKTITNLKRSSSAIHSNYIEIKPTIFKNYFDLDIQASNDIHIKISNGFVEYEIILGGWANTKSVIRDNNVEVCELLDNTIAEASRMNKFGVVIIQNILYILKNDEVILSHPIIDNYEIKQVYFKTGNGCVGHIRYKTHLNNGFYLMDTCIKSWENYYTYYTRPEYKDAIILKCDDDIVFIDLYKLPKFINFIKHNTEYDLIFANTINNGVASYIQQSMFNLIPTELMELEYPLNGFCGTLWNDGKKAEKLHNYFIDNYSKFLDYNYNNTCIPIPTRFSINFFGYKGCNWHKIADCYVDDEYNLTVNFVNTKKFKNLLYTDMYVSHLSFYKQIETHIDIPDLIQKYTTFYTTIEKDGRFQR
jgi:hypothetical protein